MRFRLTKGGICSFKNFSCSFEKQFEVVTVQFFISFLSFFFKIGLTEAGLVESEKGRY